MEDTITQNTSTVAEQAAVAPAAAPPATQISDATQPATQAAPDTTVAAFGDPVEYEPTGDANLDMALAFVGKHGLDPDHPVMEAAFHGDFAPIRAVLAEKGIQGYEAYLALAEKGWQDQQARQAEKVQAVQQIVVQAAGGDEGLWADTLAWASENAEPHEKEAANAAFEQGGLAAEAMAAFLVNQYRSASGTTYTPTATAIQPDAARGAASAAGGALSPVEYGKAVADLRRTRGVYFEETAEYRQLQARRAAWRG